MTCSRSLRRALLASSLLTLPTVAAQAQEQPLEELLVQGQYIPDEKRATSEISNVLDTADFDITGDSDIAGALQRLPGLSLVDGKFVYVRGLGERYSSVLLDGAQLPSPEPLKRVVPLDIFPTALLSNVLVQKTYSPQYPGEFGGGLVSLRTRAVPLERYFSVSVSGTYNTESTFEDGLSYDGRDMDWTGYDGSLREMPTEIASVADVNELDDDALEAAGEAIPNIWSIDSEPNPANMSAEVSYGDRFEFDEQALGILATLRYTSDFANKFGSRSSYVNSDAGLAINENVRPEVCANFEGAGDDCGYRNTTWTVGVNGMLSLGYEFNNNHSVKVQTMMLRKTERIAEIVKGELANDPGSLQALSRIDWIEQQLWSNQLSGDHFFSLFGDDAQDMNLRWHATYSQATRDVKLRRQYRYDYDDVNQRYLLSLRPDGNQTSWGDLTDDTIDVGFDFDQPISTGDLEMNIKGGVVYLETERESNFRRFHFDRPTGRFTELQQLIPEIVFGPVNVDPLGFTLSEDTDPSDTFTGSFENLQAFGQLDIQVTSQLRLAVGVRYEDSEIDITSFDRDTGLLVPFVPLTGSDLLPAATATYEFADNMQVRLAYSKTLSRPNLRELSTAIFLDDDGRETVGNPDLTITDIDNFDARWEWYFGAGETLTIGAFYKEFDSPVERVVRPFGEGLLRTWANAESAELKGVEAELEVYLPYLNKGSSSDWLSRKDFFLKLNGSYIDSEISIDPTDPTNILTDDVRPLQGQSKYLGNAQFGYDDPVSMERFAIILNYTGKRIDDVGIGGAANLIEHPPVMLGLTYAREFELWGGGFEISFEADNLLNEDFEVTQGDFVAEQYDLGRSFKIGLKATY